MKSETIRKGEEVQLILFVLIPHCKECRDRIEQTIMAMGYWERVDIGYPDREGTPVSLVYLEGKYPGVDYWEEALRAKNSLDRLGYREL